MSDFSVHKSEENKMSPCFRINILYQASILTNLYKYLQSVNSKTVKFAIKKLQWKIWCKCC